MTNADAVRSEPLAYIRRGTREMPAELVVVRDGVQVVVALSNEDLERLARQALTVLPLRADCVAP